MNELDFAPTWEAAVEICIDVLQDPNATVGNVLVAKEELRDLARHVDMLKAHIGQLQEALDEATGWEANA